MSTGFLFTFITAAADQMHEIPFQILSSHRERREKRAFQMVRLFIKSKFKIFLIKISVFFCERSSTASFLPATPSDEGKGTRKVQECPEEDTPMPNLM